MLDVWIKEEGRMAELPVHGIGDRAVPYGYDMILQDLYCVDECSYDELPEEAESADWVFDTMEEAEWAGSVLEKISPLFDLYQNELSDCFEDDFLGLYEDAISQERFDAFDGLRIKVYSQLSSYLSQRAIKMFGEKTASEVILKLRAVESAYPADSYDSIVVDHESFGESCRKVIGMADSLDAALAAVEALDWDQAACAVGSYTGDEVGGICGAYRLADTTQGILDNDVAEASLRWLEAWRLVSSARFYIKGEIEHCMKRLAEVRKALGI